MAVERIEELLNPQAVEAFKELVKVLTEAVQKEDELLKKSAQLSEQLQGGSVKNYNKTLQELNTTSEKITQTDSERLNIERELKAQSEKAIQVLKTETEEQKKLQQAIEKYTVDTEELAFSYTRLSQKVESYNAKIKNAKQEQKDLGKELRNGIITQSEYDSKVEQLVATMAEAKLNVEKYKLELAKNQQAIKANIKEEIASEGSLEQKSVQLGKLRSLWGALTESEREQAKQDGVTLQAIQRLDEELKAEEGQLGLNQRRVGEYEIAGNALGGSQVSLRTQIRNIREELAKQMMVFEQSGALIQKQKLLIDQLAVSKGKESQEYKDATIELDRLTQSQTDAQQAMQKLQEEGGKLQDIYGDAGGRIKDLSSDFANTDAAVQGVGVLVDAYTVFQSSLVAMGIESEDLMNIFAKLMILQQGMNSVSQITKALQSESILRTKLEVLWLKLKAASTKQNAIETVKDTVAMGVDTAAKGAETAATITATGANVGLSAAIKSVGVAIKSVPVIGWILAAVAALGTLTVLLYRHLSAEKELTSEQKKQEAFTKSMLSIEVETAKNTAETVTKLNAYLSVLKQVKEGSNTWKSAVKQISELTGIDYNTLVKHPKKIDEITEAWRVAYMKRSKWEAAINTISQKNADALSAKMGLSNLHLIDTSSKEFEEELSKLGKKTTDFAISLGKDNYNIEQFAKMVKKSGDKYGDVWGALLDTWVSDTQDANDKVMNSIDFSGISFGNDDNNKEGESAAEKAAEKAKELQEKKEEYVRNANQKILESETRTNDEIYNAKKEEIKREYAATIAKFKSLKLLDKDYAEVEKKAAELRDAQLGKLELDNNAVLNEKLTSLRKELYNTLDELETMRANSKLSNDELTNALVDIEVRKNDRILAENEATFEKEAAGLDEFGAEYLALRQKWDAANELQAQKSANTIENIKKTGFDKQLEDVKNSIQQVPEFASSSVTDAEYNVEVTGSAVEELEKIKSTYKDLGLTEQQYQDMSTAAQKAATDAKIALIEAEKAVRQELATTIVTGLVDIGTALAESVEDEKKRVKIQQSLALVQILLLQGIAIANAISAAVAGGDAYTAAIRIAAAVLAVTAAIISAKNAIKEAGNITGYAEGTGAGGHKGGLALMGEGKAKNGNGYEPELVEIGSKKMIVTSPVVADLPAGAIVTPFYKLQNEDRGLSLDETNSLLNNIYNKKQASVEVNVGRGIEYIVRRGLGKTKILNSRFKLN